MKHACYALSALSALFATPAAAQEFRPQRPARAPAPAQPCYVVVDTIGGDYAQRVQPNGATHFFANGGVRVSCRGTATKMAADSVAWYSDRSELRLVRQAHVEDSTATLDADHIVYWVRQERIVSEGNVYTRNIRNGSEMRGPHLDYLRAHPGIRDTLELSGHGRPTINFYPAGDSAKPDSLKTPFVIVGNIVRMRGNTRMWGSGNVTIDRPDLSARADSAHLNLADSFGVLIGAPVITGRDSAGTADTTAYRLTGQRIDFTLTGQQQVRRVLSRGDATARGRDWQLTADTMDMDVDSGRIERTQAWGEDEKRPVAVSGLSTIVADSMDIRMPDQKMQLVWAWGSARAMSRDTAAADTAQDWLVGDSLRADFAERPAPQDSTRLRTEIARVESFGNARAYYHVASETDSTRRGINYSRGDRISIAMQRRRVQTVDIVGRVDGVYLEPVRLDSATRDSLARDSLRARPDSPRPDSLRPRPDSIRPDTIPPVRRDERPGRPAVPARPVPLQRFDALTFRRSP